MVKVAQIMRECWNAKPAARLTTLRVKKSLATLMEHSETSTSSTDKYEIVYKKMWCFTMEFVVKVELNLLVLNRQANCKLADSEMDINWLHWTELCFWYIDIEWSVCL